MPVQRAQLKHYVNARGSCSDAFIVNFEQTFAH